MGRDRWPMNLLRPNRRVSLIVATLALVSLSLVSVEAQGQARERELAKPNKHVNDFAGVLDAAATHRLENILANLKRQTEIEFVIATVKTAGNQDLFDY